MLTGKAHQRPPNGMALPSALRKPTRARLRVGRTVHYYTALHQRTSQHVTADCASSSCRNINIIFTAHGAHTHTHTPTQTHAQFSFVVTLLQGAFFAVFLLFCTFTKMIALIREKEDALKEQ